MHRTTVAGEGATADPAFLHELTAARA
jgi:hypothetical protein